MSDEDDDDTYFEDVAQDHLDTNDENLVNPKDDELNLDHMDALIEDVVSKNLAIENLDVESLAIEKRVAEDTNTIIENLYCDFEQQLQLKDQYFNLYAALANIRIQLEQLDSDSQADYLQRFNALLVRYDLDSFQDQLMPKQIGVVQQNEVLPNEISEEFKDFLPSLEDTDSVYSELECESEIDDAKERLEDSIQDQFYQDLEQIVVSIQAQDFSKDQFQRFEQLITQIHDYSFEQQLDFKERVMYAFLSVDKTHYQADFFPFISLWQQYFPPEDDCLNQDYYAGQVQELTEFYQRQVQIYQQLKPSNQTAYLQLVEDQPFQPWRMLLLNGELSKQFKTSDYLDELQIANRASNANFLYLDSIRHWRQELWLFALVFLGALYYFNSILQVPALIKTLLLIASIVWYLCFLLPSKARLLSHPDRKLIQLRLNQCWFFSGIVLMITVPYLNGTVHQSLSYLWILLTVFIFSTANALLPNAVKRLFLYPQQIVADKWVMVIATSIFTFMSGIVISGSAYPNLYLFLAFMVIPAGFLLFPEYFQAMYQHFNLETMDDEDMDDDVLQQSRWQKVIKVFSIILAGAVFFMAASWLTGSTTLSLSLFCAMLCYLSIFLLAVKPSKVPYIYKYMCYTSLFIGFVYSVIVPLVILYYLYHTGREDLREYREQHQQ